MIKNKKIKRTIKDFEYFLNGNFGQISDASWTMLASTIRDRMNGVQRFDGLPLECWCLFSVKLTLLSVFILQIDGVFRCVSPGFQGNNTQEGDHQRFGFDLNNNVT